MGLWTVCNENESVEEVEQSKPGDGRADKKGAHTDDPVAPSQKVLGALSSKCVIRCNWLQGGSHV